MKTTYKFLYLLIPLILLYIAGCGGEIQINGKINMDSYKYNQITIENLTEEKNKLKIEYYTLLETLYFCPGIKIEENKNEIYLNFIRCSIKKTCQVDIESIKDKSGNKILFINNKGKTVYIKDESGKHEIYP